MHDMPMQGNTHSMHSRLLRTSHTDRVMGNVIFI